jgi:hypothetical protein
LCFMLRSSFCSIFLFLLRGTFACVEVGFGFMCIFELGCAFKQVVSLWRLFCEWSVIRARFYYDFGLCLLSPVSAAVRLVSSISLCFLPSMDEYPWNLSLTTLQTKEMHRQHLPRLRSLPPLKPRMRAGEATIHLHPRRQRRPQR